jgi:hypothetical protein
MFGALRFTVDFASQAWRNRALESGSMTMPSLPLRLVATALLVASTAAVQAQYVWIEPNGTRQYSDRPPPPGTPANRILKSPGRAALSSPPNATAEPDAKEPTAAPTLAERDAAYRARTKARAEQAQKTEQEMQRERATAERCASARELQAQLASGTRIAQYDQSGERRYLSDSERAERTARANRALQDCR